MSQRDSIPIFSKKLIEMGIVTKDEILQLENEATLVINQATEKVEDEPFP